MPISSFSRLLHATVCAGVFAVMFLAPATAKADTFTDFTLNATLANGGSESGTLTLDRTTNLFLPGTITVISDGITYTQGLFDQYDDDHGTYYINFGDQLSEGAVILPAINSLDGYQGGQIASDTFYPDVRSYFFVNGSQSDIDVQTGTLEPAAPAAVTPEPSSILLLATGLLGGAGTLLRRFHANRTA